MNKQITSRIVVAADFEPDGSGLVGVHSKVLSLAKDLRDTGVIIKINSILRAWGYTLITELQALGLKVCADLKLTDIPNTLRNDGALLEEFDPEFLTVMANSGCEGMAALREKLPKTEIWGVTVLTSLDDKSCFDIYGCNAMPGVRKLARLAKRAGLQGLILSPVEATVLVGNEECDGLNLNTPGIRYPWSEKGDQKRFLTAGEAAKNGVHRVVIGRPILNAKPNTEGKPQSRLEALQWIHDDMEKAISEMPEAKKGTVTV